jgi:hypothetical protein
MIGATLAVQGAAPQGLQGPKQPLRWFQSDMSID